jgi:hypothetical protein
MPGHRRSLAGVILTVLCIASVACDDRALPAFADPPPLDAGTDGPTDEDAGDDLDDRD